MARYTTFGQLLQWLQQPTGLTVHENRTELVEIANDVRLLHHNLYQNIPLFLDVEECIQVHRYNRKCNVCDDTYLGITLPEGMQTPEAMWVNGTPVVMNSRWRSYKVGEPPSDGRCMLQSFDMGSIWPTALDLPMDECHYLKVMTDSARDESHDKQVAINYYDRGGVERQELLDLRRDYVRTEREVRSLKAPGGILLPSDLCGAVRVALDTGEIISELAPSNTVPAYRRLQLTGVCEGEQVSVKGARDFVPLYFDYDVVEHANKRAFVEGALFLRYNDSVTSDPSFAQAALLHEQRMREQLLGDKAREMGKATRKQKILSEGRVRRSGLHSKAYNRIRHLGRVES